jgi:hypothetical protein
MSITINGSGSIAGLSVGGLPDGSINNADLASNAVSTSKILNGAVTTAKLGSDEQSGLCKAWVNFNGTSTVTIRASFNVSSITDNGTGDYTVNFTTALVDANYAVVAASGRSATATRSAGYIMHRNFAAGSFDFQTSDTSNGALDHAQVTLAIFR